MTWVSLRSGMASSGSVCSAHQPVTAAAATSRKTSSRLRAENSMIVLIMIGSRRRSGFQLAFRIDEKIARGHDALAGFQPASNFDAAVRLLADADLARLEEAVPAIDEDHLSVARIEHGRLRHDQAAHAAGLQIDL